MKKAIFLAIGLLLCASIVQGAVCSTPPNGNASFRFGWGMNTAGMSPYTPPPGVYNLVSNNGPDTTWGIPGQPLLFKVAPYNATAWLDKFGGAITCVNQDTLCYDVWSQNGWTFVTNPAAGTPQVLPAGGYLWYQTVTIQIPCNAVVGSYERVIGRTQYTNSAIVCDPTCVDCTDPDMRPANGSLWYSSDTLYVHVLPAPPPPAPTILQDSLTLVERGQTQAYIPFSLCNGDQCFAYDIGYTIKSKGHVGSALNVSGVVNVAGGKCVDVFGIINAGTATTCTYDTLTTICWTVVVTPLYDTCVQIIHVVDPSTVPLFTVPVVTILVLALILAAAVFMRRRAVSKA
jgi:hypothetical protein